MEKTWKTPVRAMNVEFRILRSGITASAYDRNWKSADVSFSFSNDKEHVMTVEYKYGKRIDIKLENAAEKCQVQPESGRVTISSPKKRSTFSIRSVKQNDLLRIQRFFNETSQAQREYNSPSAVNKLDQNVSSAEFKHPSSPHKVDQKRCYIDEKVKPGDSPSGNKRHRTSLSPNKTDTSPVCRRPSESASNFEDFRKISPGARYRKKRTSDDDDGKENTSPDELRLKNGMNKRSFYGTKVNYILPPENHSHLFSSSPAKLTKSTPGRQSQESSPKLTPARRSLPLGKSPLEDSTTAISELDVIKAFAIPCDLAVDSNNNNEEEGPPSYQPLQESGNLTQSRNTEGFQNLGNTCYMNATLQSLFGLLPFQKDLQELGSKISDRLYTDSVFITVADLMNHKSSAQYEKAVYLKKVKRAISSNAKQFQGSAQQDAHEFLRLCLDLLQEDLIKVNKGITAAPDEDGNRCSVSDVITQEPYACPVSKNFSFTVKQQITCTKCKSITSKDDELYDLPVNLQSAEHAGNSNSLRLQKLIELSFASEDVEHQCEKCECNKATVTHIINRLPRIMMIYLQRYSYNQTYEYSEKLRRRVSLPRFITFHKLCDENVSQDTPPSGHREFRETSLLDDHSSGDSHPEIRDTSLLDDHAGGNNKKGKEELSDLFKQAARHRPFNGLISDDVNMTWSFDKLESNDSKARKKMQSNNAKSCSTKTSLLPDASELQTMTEEEQVQLALQLSMEENGRSAGPETDWFDSMMTPDDSFSELPSLSKITKAARLNFKSELEEESTSLSNIDISKLSKTPESSEKSISIEYVSDDEILTLHSIAVQNRKSSNAATKSTTSSTTTDDTSPSVPESPLGEAEDVVSVGSPPNKNPPVSPALPSQSILGLITEAAITADHFKEPREPSQDSDDSEEMNEELKNESTGRLPFSYRLVSIVSHKGGSSKFGHYTSDVMTNYATNKWQYFDDTFVETVTETDVLLGRQSTSYLLFYLQKDFL